MEIHLSNKAYNEVLRESRAYLEKYTRAYEKALNERTVKHFTPAFDQDVDICMGIVAHRVMKAILPKEYKKMTELSLKAIRDEELFKNEKGDR